MVGTVIRFSFICPGASRRAGAGTAPLQKDLIIVVDEVEEVGGVPVKTAGTFVGTAAGMFQAVIEKNSIDE